MPPVKAALPAPAKVYGCQLPSKYAARNDPSAPTHHTSRSPLGLEIATTPEVREALPGPASIVWAQGVPGWYDATRTEPSAPTQNASVDRASLATEATP